MDIFPPGILILDNLVKVFWAAGFAREFQFCSLLCEVQIVGTSVGKCCPNNVVNDDKASGRT